MAITDVMLRRAGHVLENNMSAQCALRIVSGNQAPNGQFELDLLPPAKAGSSRVCL
jgi:hypothetical protein